MDSPYLSTGNHKVVATFLMSPLWVEMKRCLYARRPAPAATTDETHVAAAKGHARFGYEQCILDIEKLPTESDQPPPDPFKRDALDPRD